MANLVDVICLSLVSGKGGVGKTTLSLALAQELSVSGNSVLLLDLDFGNRGLQELISNSSQANIKNNTPKKIQHPLSHDSEIEIHVLDLHQNIQTVTLPVFSREDLSDFDSLSSSDAKTFICNIVHAAFEVSRADVVIFDCHGSRDVISYGACALSEHIIVVGTHDKITFFGTSRFVQGLKQLEQVVHEHQEVHLVYNAIPDGIRTQTLLFWYRRFFRQYFNGKTFLAVFPLEPKVSIASSRELFPTQKFYYSHMAEKMRLLLVDLFGKDKRLRLAPESRLIARTSRMLIWPHKSIFSIILDVRLPVGVLLGAVSCVYLLWLSLLYVGQPEALAGFVSDQSEFSSIFLTSYLIFSIIFVMFIWAIVTYISRSLIELDTTLCGEIKHMGAARAWIAMWKVGLVCLGSSLLLAIPIVLGGDVSTDEESILIGILGLFLERSTVERMMELQGSVDRSVVTITYVIGGYFALVFLTRWIRTLIFRALSVESIYRTLVVLMGTALYIRHYV